MEIVPTDTAVVESWLLVEVSLYVFPVVIAKLWLTSFLFQTSPMKLAKVVDPRNKEKDPVSACTLIDIVTSLLPHIMFQSENFNSRI